jgi:hypothetical protein
VSRRAAELSARTMIFDVEPLAAYWDSGPGALDRGIAYVLGEVAAVPGLQVVCFATNSLRHVGSPGLGRCAGDLPAVSGQAAAHRALPAFSPAWKW